MDRVVVRRILMALVLMIGVAATAVLVTDQRGNRQTRISLGGRDAPGRSDGIPEYLVWPSPDDFRSRQTAADTGGVSAEADVPDLVREYLMARLGAAPGSLHEADLILGPAELVSEALGHVSYRVRNERISPGQVSVGRAEGPSGLWYVTASGNDRLFTFEMERDGDRRSGHLVPTVDGVARVRLQVQGLKVLADEEREVVEKHLLRFEATSSSPVILTVLLQATDGVVSLTELVL